jgi:hypothetical protein
MNRRARTSLSAHGRPFADAIARGRADVNTLRDARQDLEIAVEIIEALRKTAWSG